MPPDVTCPACQHRVVVPNGAEGPAGCPRCGAALPRTEVRPAPGDIQTTRSAPAALATTECPACGKAVPELCLLCPHCEEPLAERHRIRGPGAGKWRPFPERCLRPLALVGAVTLLLSLAAALAPLTAGRQGAGPAAIGFFLLVLFLLMCLG